MASFQEKVKEHRGLLGLTQKQLAERAGIGYRTIITYESGERFPHAAQLYKLAKALGVSTEYLKMMRSMTRLMVSTAWNMLNR